MPRLSVSQMKPLTYLLTYSIVQSPFWEANWFAASQEIPHISRNPKVHYRTHKRPPPVSILGQPNPVHIPTSHLLEIHPTIIHPSTPRSPQWSPSLRFPHQEPVRPPLLTHTSHEATPPLNGLSKIPISTALYWAENYRPRLMANRNSSDFCTAYRYVNCEIKQWQSNTIRIRLYSFKCVSNSAFPNRPTIGASNFINFRIRSST